MKRKLKIIAKVAKKAIKKTSHLTRKNFYKGYSAPEVAYKAISYPFRHGLRATTALMKREMLRIGSKSNVKHHFPNGLVSGVDTSMIADWYSRHSRKVSIVIPSYNDWEVLKPAVDSIHATCSRKDTYEVIVIDDYCQPDNRERLKTLEDANTRVIFRKNNGGFAKAVNTGLKAVSKEHDVILFNSDVVAHPGWLEALQYGAYGFGNHKEVGIVAPKLLYPDGRIQSAGSYRNTEATEWFDHYYRFQPADYGPANVPTFVQSATGAVLYAKREFLDKVGLLDEGCAFAFDDADWCLRGWSANLGTLYFPAATLTHHESATRAKNKTIGDKERKAVVYFWKKWDKWFNERNVRNKDGKIRIIYVLQTVGWSGGIKMVFEHANRLKKLGFDVEIWSLSGKPVWPLEVKHRTFKNYDQLTAALEPEQAIKVGTWWETLYPVWKAALRHGIAVNFLQEIETWFYPDDPDAQRVVVSCYRKEFKYLTTASYNLDEIRSFGLNAAVIPCGYDSDIFKPLPDVKREDDVLLALGRRFFQKNFMFSFRAWKKLGESRPRFWLFGGEPDMKTLDSKITYFTKPSEQEVNKLHNQSTVFVQTSYHEGFCLPILEAMATGAAIVCTDAHGNRDFCHNGKNCIVVPHDDEKMLVDAYKKLFSNAKLREKLGKAAKETAKRYQWSVVTDELKTYYENLAQETPIFPMVERKYGKKR